MSQRTVKARFWQRVSSGGQDEANQLPDLIKWGDSHGYEYDLNERYILHGKSASKGKHQAALDQAVADMAAGEYEVLVVWQSSRIERRGAWSAFDLARRVHEAGGRIEYVQDAYLNETNEMSDVMLALAATKDKQKSQDISKQVKSSYQSHKANGALWGRAPFGYRITGEKNAKSLVIDKAKAEAIRECASAYLKGASLEELCVWLDANGFKTSQGKRWSAWTLGNLFRNPILVGRRTNASGRTVFKAPAILERWIWDQLQTELNRKANRKGVAPRQTALLTSIIHCAKCSKPMYRIKPRQGERYYCRSGKGACRNMLPLEAMDEFVNEALTMPQPIGYGDLRITETVTIPGDGHQDEIDEVKRDMTEAVQAEDFGRLAELQAELARLRTLPAEPAKTVERPTDVTVAEHWATLDTQAKRAYLLKAGVKVMAARGLLDMGNGYVSDAVIVGQPDKISGALARS